MKTVKGGGSGWRPRSLQGLRKSKQRRPRRGPRNLRGARTLAQSRDRSGDRAQPSCALSHLLSSYPQGDSRDGKEVAQASRPVFRMHSRDLSKQSLRHPLPPHGPLLRPAPIRNVKDTDHTAMKTTLSSGQLPGKAKLFHIPPGASTELLHSMGRSTVCGHTHRSYQNLKKRGLRPCTPWTWPSVLNS